MVDNEEFFTDEDLEMGGDGVPSTDAQPQEEGQAQQQTEQDYDESLAQEQQQQADVIDSEPKEQEEQPEQPDEKWDGKVPLRELKAEREKRQELEQKFQVLTERTSAMLARQQYLQSQGNVQQAAGAVPQQQEQQYQQPQVTPYEEDPLENHQDRLRQLEGDVNAYKQQQQGQQQYNQRVNQVMQAVQPLAQEYVQQNPEAVEAIKYLRDSRVKEMTLQGVPEHQAHQQVDHEEFQVMEMALSNGQHPMQIAHEMAKARGFAPAQKEKPVENPQQNFDTVKKGQQRAQSLSTMGNSGQSTAMSVEDILAMQPDEWGKLLKSGKLDEMMRNDR